MFEVGADPHQSVVTYRDVGQAECQPGHLGGSQFDADLGPGLDRRPEQRAAAGRDGVPASLGQLGDELPAHPLEGPFQRGADKQPHRSERALEVLPGGMHHVAQPRRSRRQLRHLIRLHGRALRRAAGRRLAAVGPPATASDPQRVLDLDPQRSRRLLDRLHQVRAGWFARTLAEHHKEDAARTGILQMGCNQLSQLA